MSFRQGDIITYSPDSLFRRDGIAEVHASWQDGSPFARDTFDMRDTRLSPEELATGAVLFNTEEFIECPFIDEAEYANDDIRVLKVRKGIATRKFLRRGAAALPQDQIVHRRQQVRAEQVAAARQHLLSPADDQVYASSPLPTMTDDEATEVSDRLRWISHASAAFDSSLENLVRIVQWNSGNMSVQTTLTDEAHYELVRARRSLDRALASLRA